jgi:hypothetical protein
MMRQSEAEMQEGFVDTPFEEIEDDQVEESKADETLEF